MSVLLYPNHPPFRHLTADFVNLRRGEQPRCRRKHVTILDANVLLIEMAQCGQMFPKRPTLRGVKNVVCEPLSYK